MSSEVVERLRLPPRPLGQQAAPDRQRRASLRSGGSSLKSDRRSSSATVASRRSALSVIYDEQLFQVNWTSWATLVLVVSLPIAIVVTLSAVEIAGVVRLTHTSEQLNADLGLIRALFELCYSLQRERGIACLYHDSQAAERLTVYPILTGFRRDTDRLLTRFNQLENDHGPATACLQAMAGLFDHRRAVDTSAVDCQHNIEYYTAHIRCLTSKTFAILHLIDEGQVYIEQHALMLRGVTSLYIVSEGSRTLSHQLNGANDTSLMTELIRDSSAVDEITEVIAWSSEQARQQYMQFTIDWLGEYSWKRHALLLAASHAPPLNATADFYCSWYQATLEEDDKAALAFTTDVDRSAFRSAMTLLVVGVLLVLLAGLCALLGVAYGYGSLKKMHEIQSMMSEVGEKNVEVRLAKAKGDQLLYGMIPPSVAGCLKAGKRVLPFKFECATVSFMQVRRFDEHVLLLDAEQVVGYLNTVYCMIDELLEDFDVYKVETINDTYMIASGLPEMNGAEHSRVMCEFVQTAIGLLRRFKLSDTIESIALSAGINTGSCVASVIGSRQPRYCLFGDTVNVASRMNSSGREYLAQLSSKTADHLKHWHDGVFKLAARGQIAVKGRGNMSTYWLLPSGRQRHSDSEDDDQSSTVSIKSLATRDQ